MEIKRLTDKNDPLYEKAMALYKKSASPSMSSVRRLRSAVFCISRTITWMWCAITAK